MGFEILSLNHIATYSKPTISTILQWSIEKNTLYRQLVPQRRNFNDAKQSARVLNHLQKLTKFYWVYGA